MSQREEEGFRGDIVEVGRRMYARGYVASNDGNISIRLDDATILTTPKSVSKGFMTPDMMVVVGLDGKKIRGTRDASSELLMHLEVYKNRPDVRAVVHAHPPIATGFAVAGIPLDRAVLAEVVTTLGSIPIAEYGTPSTPELPAAVRKYIKAHDGLLLANHGALTIGPDVYAAYYKMETIEHFAKISLVTRQLGRENLLSREEVHRLAGAARQLRHQGARADLRGRFRARRTTIRHPARSSKLHPRAARGSFPTAIRGCAIWTGKFGYHTASLRPSLRMP